MHVGIAYPWWRAKRSRHSRRMRKPQFYVSDERPMETCIALVTLIFGCRSWKVTGSPIVLRIFIMLICVKHKNRERMPHVGRPGASRFPCHLTELRAMTPTIYDGRSFAVTLVENDTAVLFVNIESTNCRPQNRTVEAPCNWGMTEVLMGKWLILRFWLTWHFRCITINSFYLIVFDNKPDPSQYIWP